MRASGGIALFFLPLIRSEPQEFIRTPRLDFPLEQDWRDSAYSAAAAAAGFCVQQLRARGVTVRAFRGRVQCVFVCRSALQPLG